MRIARTLGALALALAGTATMSTTARAQDWIGGVLTAPTSSMLFEFVSRDASFTHQLGLFSYNGGSPLFIESIFTSPPDGPGATRTVSLVVGQQYVLGLFSPQARDCYLYGLACSTRPTTFFSNGTADPAELPHSDGNFVFGGTMEDGWTTIRIEDDRDGKGKSYWIGGPFGPSDNDYDDMVIRAAAITTTPEPGTVALLGTGIVGLAGFGVARRRRQSSRG